MGLFGHIEARRGARFVRHIYLDENAPNLVGGSRASFLIEIEDGNPRAFARQLPGRGLSQSGCSARYDGGEMLDLHLVRSEEHTSELQSLMRISYAVFCLKKKKKKHNITETKNRYNLINMHE